MYRFDGHRCCNKSVTLSHTIPLFLIPLRQTFSSGRISYLTRSIPKHPLPRLLILQLSARIEKGRRLLCSDLLILPSTPVPTPHMPIRIGFLVIQVQVNRPCSGLRQVDRFGWVEEGMTGSFEDGSESPELDAVSDD